MHTSCTVNEKQKNKTHKGADNKRRNIIKCPPLQWAFFYTYIRGGIQDLRLLILKLQTAADYTL